METLYKYSQFNVIAKKTSESVTVINTYTQSYVTMPIDIFKSIRLNKIESDIDNEVIESRVIVPKKIDEYYSLIKNIEEKTQQGNLQFVIAPSMSCNYRCEYCFEEDRTHKYVCKRVDFSAHVHQINQECRDEW